MPGTYTDIVNLALRRGLFFPAGEVYGAPAGFYDYGPFGAAIKRKVIELWRRELVQKEEFLEIDGAITLPEDVFKASGHLANFNDPMTQCASCKTLHRADKLLEEITKKPFKEAMAPEVLTKALREYKVHCPACKGELLDVRQFNMLVKAEVGIATKAPCYLRPETCQTLFADWPRMMKTMRVKLPKGLSQVGKSFRNEISPRQTLLRQVEFTQMESEVLFDPAKIDDVPGFDEVAEYPIQIMRVGSQTIEPIAAKELASRKIVSGKLIAYFLARTQQLYEKYGFGRDKMRFRELDGEERAFYAKEGWDFEVLTSLGWLELIANNYRTDYDLAGHAKGSKTDMNYVMDDGRKFIPHIWEISIGTDRTFYAVIENSLRVKSEARPGETGREHEWLALPPALAPLHAAVFPLLSNKQPLVDKAGEVYRLLKKAGFEVFLDEAGSIGKRYARMDEIGVPACITIDFDTVEKDAGVTLRERDSTRQERIPIAELPRRLHQLIWGGR
jgi:glycyl-tRNA synthetase